MVCDLFGWGETFDTQTNPLSWAISQFTLKWCTIQEYVSQYPLEKVSKANRQKSCFRRAERATCLLTLKLQMHIFPSGLPAVLFRHVLLLRKKHEADLAWVSSYSHLLFPIHANSLPRLCSLDLLPSQKMMTNDVLSSPPLPSTLRNNSARRKLYRHLPMHNFVHWREIKRVFTQMQIERDSQR